MTGLETAELLMEQGNHVTMVEMADSIVPGATGINAMEVKKALDEGGTRLLPGRELREIGDHVVVLKDTRTKAISTHPFDAVVLSLDMRGNYELPALYRTLRDEIQRRGTLGFDGSMISGYAFFFSGIAVVLVLGNGSAMVALVFLMALVLASLAYVIWLRNRQPTKASTCLWATKVIENPCSLPRASLRLRCAFACLDRPQAYGSSLCCQLLSCSCSFWTPLIARCPIAPIPSARSGRAP